MTYSTTFRNQVVDAVGASATANVYSLHTADPGTTGASEVSGGSPAYARKTATGFPSASSGSSTNSTVTFDVPTSTTITHWGRWLSGAFYEGGPLPSPQAFATQGTYALTHTLSHPA